uniref:Uncharacterized protein n=1 Tax=Eutreptiella gymnastica TaxID=73025 RepID=A0A7S4GF03_9EUGL
MEIAFPRGQLSVFPSPSKKGTFHPTPVAMPLATPVERPNSLLGAFTGCKVHKALGPKPKHKTGFASQDVPSPGPDILSCPVRSVFSSPIVGRRRSAGEVKYSARNAITKDEDSLDLERCSHSSPQLQRHISKISFFKHDLATFQPVSSGTSAKGKAAADTATGNRGTEPSGLTKHPVHRSILDLCGDSLTDNSSSRLELSLPADLLDHIKSSFLNLPSPRTAEHGLNVPLTQRHGTSEQRAVSNASALRVGTADQSKSLVRVPASEQRADSASSSPRLTLLGTRKESNLPSSRMMVNTLLEHRKSSENEQSAVLKRSIQMCIEGNSLVTRRMEMEGSWAPSPEFQASPSTSPIPVTLDSIPGTPITSQRKRDAIHGPENIPKVPTTPRRRLEMANGTQSTAARKMTESPKPTEPPKVTESPNVTEPPKATESPTPVPVPKLDLAAEPPSEPGTERSTETAPSELHSTRMLRQLSQTVVPPPGRRADLSPRTYINRIFDLKIEDDDIEPWSYSPREPTSQSKSTKGGGAHRERSLKLSQLQPVSTSLPLSPAPLPPPVGLKNDSSMLLLSTNHHHHRRQSLTTNRSAKKCLLDTMNGAAR